MEECAAGRERDRRRVRHAPDALQRMLIQLQLLWRTSSIYIQHPAKQAHPPKCAYSRPRRFIGHLRVDLRYHHPRPFQCSNTLYTQGPEPPSAKTTAGSKICCAPFPTCWRTEAQRLVLLRSQRFDSNSAIRPCYSRYCAIIWRRDIFPGGTDWRSMEPEVWRCLG